MHTEPLAENRSRVFISPVTLLGGKPSFCSLELLNFIICAIFLDTVLLQFSLQTAVRVAGVYTIDFSSGKTLSNKIGSSLILLCFSSLQTWRLWA